MGPRKLPAQKEQSLSDLDLQVGREGLAMASAWQPRLEAMGCGASAPAPMAPRVRAPKKRTQAGCTRPLAGQVARSLLSKSSMT